MSKHTLELHARDAADVGSYSDVAALHGNSHTPRVATTPSSHIHRSFEFWTRTIGGMPMVAQSLKNRRQC